MRLYYVNDDLSRRVTVFYDLDEAERNTNQYCHVNEVDFNQMLPRAMAAYNPSHERFRPLYEALAS